MSQLTWFDDKPQEMYRTHLMVDAVFNKYDEKNNG